MRVVPGSPEAQFLETLSPDDPRHYGLGMTQQPIRPGGRPALGGFGTPNINSFNSTPFPAPLTQQLGTVNNNVKGGGDFTLAGMTQQPIQQPMQNPLGGGLSSLNQQPFGGGFNSFNQQPFGGGLGSMNQQPLQINGGLKAILDNYINNYINNYFMNALK